MQYMKKKAKLVGEKPVHDLEAIFSRLLLVGQGKVLDTPSNAAY